MHSHGSFASLPLIWYWEYTQNITFLADQTLATNDTTATPYALIKGLAEWWVCHLTRESEPGAQDGDGYVYVDLDDCAYEDSNYYTRPSRHPQSQNLCNATGGDKQFLPNPNNRTNTSPILRNPAISLGLIRKVLATAIDMASALDIDKDKRSVWQDRLMHLAPFPTSWVANPQDPNAKVQVFLAQEYPRYFPGSLNPLNLYALWPGTMSATTPQLRAIGRQTVTAMATLGSWQEGNAFPEMVPASVRAQLNPNWILGNISARVNATMAQSGVMAEGAETQGATQGVNDMLCASYEGVIRLFSVWPLEENCSFTHLRAKGGFLVSAQLRSGVVVAPVNITSSAGKMVVLQTPPGWPSNGIHVVGSDDSKPDVMSGKETGTWQWSTEIDVSYVVSPS